MSSITSSIRKSKRLIQKSSLNQINSDDEADNEQVTSTRSNPEIRMRKLEKQVTSLTEAMKTLIDLQKASLTSGTQVSQSQSNHLGPLPVSPRVTPDQSTNPNMTAEQLMFQTAKMNANQSNIEKNMKKWDVPTQKCWINYKDLWIEYVKNGGQKSLLDLCTKDVIINLKIILNINDLRGLNLNDLFNLINEYFKTNSNCQSLLNSLTMEDLKYYNREKTEQFFNKLLILLDTHPQMYDIGEEVLVESFFTKLKPASLSSQLLFLKVKTIAGASKALEDFYTRKDSMIDEIHLDKSSSKSIPDKTNNDFKEKKKKDNNEEKKLYTRKGKLVECHNCKHAPKSKNKNTNHYLSSCPSLGYCYQCETQHFPLGHDCKYEDVSLFNYDKYLENKRESDSTIPPEPKNKKKSKEKNKDDGKFMETLNAMTATSAGFDKVFNILRTNHKGLTISDDVDKVFKEMILFFDSAANGTHINHKDLSDTPIVSLNRMDPTQDNVTLAGEQQIPIGGSGSI